MAHSSLVLWFTGMSGAGKSTIAQRTYIKLQEIGLTTLVLDGDTIRNSLHKHLSFSKEDIMENNRLVSELCFEKTSDFNVIIVPIISPYKISRKRARKLIGSKFFEIYIETPLSLLIKRDSKGLYQKTIDGKMHNLIGFSKDNIYEKPENPDLTINTSDQTIEESVKKLMKHVQKWMD